MHTASTSRTSYCVSSEERLDGPACLDPVSPCRVSLQGVMFVSHAMEIKTNNLSSSVSSAGAFAELKVPTFHQCAADLTLVLSYHTPLLCIQVTVCSASRLPLCLRITCDCKATGWARHATLSLEPLMDGHHSMSWALHLMGSPLIWLMCAPSSWKVGCLYAVMNAKMEQALDCFTFNLQGRPMSGTRVLRRES